MHDLSNLRASYPACTLHLALFCPNLKLPLMPQRHCLTLDLKNDPALIAEYKRYHENVWPEIKQSLHDSGILDMEIYLLGTRMCMIIETADSFSFAKKAELDRNNPKVMEWEALMGKFQQPFTADARPEARWLPMDRVFKFTA